jgi:hypothetical protein
MATLELLPYDGFHCELFVFDGAIECAEKEVDRLARESEHQVAIGLLVRSLSACLVAQERVAH